MLPSVNNFVKSLESFITAPSKTFCPVEINDNVDWQRTNIYSEKTFSVICVVMYERKKNKSKACRSRTDNFVYFKKTLLLDVGPLSVEYFNYDSTRIVVIKYICLF